MSKDNGGPAFPTVYANLEGHFGTTGLTLRDYFAAKAMAARISNTNASFGVGYAVNNENLAVESYAIADAMLAERAK